jgi:uncharacterized protein YbjT (DUF2867 family)
MSRHVVFGTGQVGHPLVQRLVADGHDVVAVNRNGHRDFPGATVIGGDATDPAFTAAVCAGADVVYFCLNAMSYEQWAVEFPTLQRGVLDGAARAGARLVVLDNLYSDGPPRGHRIVESLEANPTSTKAATRASRGGRRGGHRPGVGLLRPRRHAIRPGRERLRRRAGGQDRSGDGGSWPAAQLLLHP